MPPTTKLSAAMSADELAPTASGTIDGVLLSPGIYKDYATVVLSATDPVIPGQEDQTSGLLKIEYSLDNGPYEVYGGPFTVSAGDLMQ